MASPASEELVPLAEATKITRLDSHVYGANLVSAWCVSSVPNGGYVASVILRAASLHLAGRGQPDTISAHYSYVNRTEIGPAVLIIEESKLGRTTSTVHVTLHQHDLQPAAPWLTARSRRNVLAYVTNNAGLSLERGLTLATGWSLTPPPEPVDLGLLALGRDPHWARREERLGAGRFNSFVRAHNNLEYYSPRDEGNARRGVADVWLRLQAGERFTKHGLGYLADAYPMVVEGWRPLPDDEEQTPFRSDEMLWYPTLSLNLDVKRALPEEGAEWLFVRSSARVIQNGRLDLEVIILDQHQNVVALSNHVNIIVSAERSLKERSHAKGKI